MSEGHSEATYYPIGRVFDECNIVVERENARKSLDALLAQRAYGAVTSKKGGPLFQELLKKLEFVTSPIKGLLTGNR